MSASTARSLGALLVAASLAGCGASSAQPGASRAQLTAGRRLFALSCSTCHSISGTPKPSQQGGDLRSFHSTRPQLRQLSAEMPVLHPPGLSSSQLTAVVNYVIAVETGRTAP